VRYTGLGATGVQVSRLCLGCGSFGQGMTDWTLDQAASRPIMEKAIEAGINFFDTADIYSRGQSEEILGNLLKDFALPREETVIATKLFYPLGDGPNSAGLSRKRIMHSIDDSLRRLRVDYVDLYLIHRFDYHTPIEETIAALDDVVRAGKALHIGASTMYAYQFARYLAAADRLGRTRFSVMQNSYNLAYREEEREMIPLCREEGIGLMPWAPLAGGFLAGTYESGTARSRSSLGRHEGYDRPEDQHVVETLRRVAARRGVPPAQVAIAWVLSKPGVSAPVIGASKAAHLDDPVAALDLVLTREEIAELEAAYTPQRVIGPIPPPEDAVSGAD